MCEIWEETALMKFMHFVVSYVNSVAAMQANIDLLFCFSLLYTDEMGSQEIVLNHTSEP